MSTASEGKLEVREVVKRYGDALAVAGVSLETRPGEFLTLLGPSGSGKTTTLGMIAGFERPTEGRVLLDGRDLSTVPPHRRDIGVVFQNYALFPHMSAAANVGFPLRMRGVGRQEISRRVADAMALVELDGLGSRRPNELSGGQQQRVAFARAVVFEPRLLLMDEPLGALDKKLRETLQLEVMRISRQLGVTVVYVTHDQDEALVMSDRIAVYRSGRIEQVGTAEDLYEHPRSVFVADFIGDSNIVRGRFRRRAGADVLECSSFELKVADPPEGLQSGESAALVVRPERLRIELATEAARSLDRHNELLGTVEEAIYLGNARVYLVAVAGGVKLRARAEISLGAPRAEPGARVRVTWSPADARLLPDDELGNTDKEDQS
jgi:putative spermidine/putrescine transport system ATP-binding protein